MYDVIIENGAIMDGTGNPWYKADIAVKGEKIDGIGNFKTERAEKKIDAKGCVVSPGFIDIHNHSDLILTLKEHPQILSPFIRQGTTTLVIGNCGISVAPITTECLDLVKGYTALLTAGSPPWSWRSFSDHLALLEKQGVMFNVAALVGQGTIRFNAMGARDTPADKAEVNTMKRLLSTALEEGAFGMSAGLIYPPGMWTPTSELIELCSVVAKYGGIFTCHVRGSSETGVNSEKEIIEIAVKTGVRVQHSHHEAFGEKFWNQVKETTRLDEEARQKGIDIAFDVIPYTSANTYLLAIFPPWALEGGVPKLIERLKDPTTRAKIKKDVLELIPTWPPWKPGQWPHNLVEATGWENIDIISVPSGRKKDWEGKSLSQLGKTLGKDPFDVAADLIIEEGGGVMALYFGVTGNKETDEGVRFLLSHPLASVGPDAILTGVGKPHPAAYGSFPRIIGHYARDHRLFTMEDAVRKVTWMNATRIGIRDRGLVKTGMYADLAVFDPKKIRDRATYSNPTQYPEGIKHVIVNGRVVVEKEKHCPDVLAGHVLRRGR